MGCDVKSVVVKSSYFDFARAMNIKDTIGARIRELRKAKKLSQEYLAFLCGLDRTYIGSVENGKRNISIENIEKIARALSVSLRELFNHDNFDASETPDRKHSQAQKSHPSESTSRVQTPDRISDSGKRRAGKE